MLSSVPISTAATYEASYPDVDTFAFPCTAIASTYHTIGRPPTPQTPRPTKLAQTGASAAANTCMRIRSAPHPADHGEHALIRTGFQR